ncbi:insecticidal delta-endotoxin Cry8Ea1 family protein, partial [Bacillus thuringiensis]|uniref:insecticidal delta-endotoxin Cry8Ea1 family protein n=1 Tax=Bacillus thuringiensis TaxID=1428 RepID=UPI003335E826
MPSFRVLGFEVPLLVVFAQAANLHLQLLRDAVKFGEGWDLPSIEIENLYTRLTNRTREYTDHCVDTYNKGLDQAYTLQASPQNGGLYGAEEDWNKFNDFRRDMTIMVLDLIAVWPTYDPLLYTMPVTVELSRTIYTSVRGYKPYTSKSQIEHVIVKPPRLVTWLQNFRIYQGYLEEVYNSCIPSDMVTCKNNLHYTQSGTTWEEGPPVTNRRYADIYNFSGNIGEVVTTVCASGRPFVLELGFRNKSGQSIGHTRTGLSTSLTYLYNSVPKAENSEEHSHRLAFLDGLQTTATIYPPPEWPSGPSRPSYESEEFMGIWGFGWVHNSLTETNTIFSDKTTQIPAVKGYHVDHGATVVRGPGSTGGDLVRLPAYNQEWTQLRIMVQPSLTAR